MIDSLLTPPSRLSFLTSYKNYPLSAAHHWNLISNVLKFDVDTRNLEVCRTKSDLHEELVFRIKSRTHGTSHDHELYIVMAEWRWSLIQMTQNMRNICEWICENIILLHFTLARYNNITLYCFSLHGMRGCYWALEEGMRRIWLVGTQTNGYLQIHFKRKQK